jgi:hypothetical protein
MAWDSRKGKSTSWSLMTLWRLIRVSPGSAVPTCSIIWSVFLVPSIPALISSRKKKGTTPNPPLSSLISSRCHHPGASIAVLMNLWNGPTAWHAARGHHERGRRPPRQIRAFLDGLYSQNSEWLHQVKGTPLASPARGVFRSVPKGKQG